RSPPTGGRPRSGRLRGDLLLLADLRRGRTGGVGRRRRRGRPVGRVRAHRPSTTPPNRNGRPHTRPGRGRSGRGRGERGREGSVRDQQAHGARRPAVGGRGG